MSNRVFALARFVAKVSVAWLIAASLSGCFGYSVVKGDNAPHPAVARARAMPVQGIDVSRYQGRIDFDAAHAAGTNFVFIKATEGADYIDPNFHENWSRARAAGMPRAAYHFMAWCSLARDQAEWFKRMVPPDPDALPPVLDLEWNHSSSCKKRFSREDTLEKIRVMLAEMEAHTGKIPIIYTDITFHRDMLEGEQFDNAFWLRSTAAEPHTRYSGRDWTFWQWTQTGTMPGIHAEVDRNSFYGTEAEWVRFLLTGCDPRVAYRLALSGKCGGLK
jgi:lysozyme